MRLLRLVVDSLTDLTQPQTPLLSHPHVSGRNGMRSVGKQGNRFLCADKRKLCMQTHQVCKASVRCEALTWRHLKAEAKWREGEAERRVVIHAPAPVPCQPVRQTTLQQEATPDLI